MNEILPEPPQATPINGVAQVADFLVVGIGASAGGLKACSKLLDGLGEVQVIGSIEDETSSSQTASTTIFLTKSNSCMA